MGDSILWSVVLGYVVIAIVLADLFIRFLLWQRFSPFHRGVANLIRQDRSVLAFYYFSWLLLWPLFLVCYLLPFFFLLIRVFLRQWWYGLKTPFIIGKPVVSPPEWAEDLSPGRWQRDPAVWDALDRQDIHDVLLIKCRYCKGRSYYDGGEHAHCFHCDKDLTPDLESHMPPWPRVVPDVLTVAQAIEKEDEEKAL